MDHEMGVHPLMYQSSKPYALRESGSASYDSESLHSFASEDSIKKPVSLKLFVFEYQSCWEIDFLNNIYNKLQLKDIKVIIKIL